jgi:hypothetical protein
MPVPYTHELCRAKSGEKEHLARESKPMRTVLSWIQQKQMPMPLLHVASLVNECLIARTKPVSRCLMLTYSYSISVRMDVRPNLRKAFSNDGLTGSWVLMSNGVNIEECFCNPTFLKTVG